ncbi:MAG: ROK family protein [Clostridia bacterium]|nr:ROK family protein [Clostridia bacterium]
MKYYLGMDIGGTKCAVVISEKSGAAIKDKIRFETRVERGYELVIAELISSARELIERNCISIGDVLACGVSCGGPLNSETGVIMRPPNLPDWDNVPLADIVSRELGVPCKIRNDADACALAEWQFGAGRGTKNMIFLTFGTGMGAGLILDGRLYSGTSGTAGEVGHIRLDADGPVAYGKAGSFEGFCSGAGIASMGKKMLALYNGETSIPYDNVTAKTIAEAATGGDRLANAIYRRCGEKLGLGLSILIDILNPERIVIGSIFQRSGRLLVDSMNETIKKEALAISAECCKIVPAMLGDEIGDFAAIGVAKDFAEGAK